MPVVKSSNIHSIDYVEEEQELTIEFNSGRTYVYFEVPKNIYDEALAADSVGKFFHKNIKNVYDFERLD